jgi:hypothetical protein
VDGQKWAESVTAERKAEARGLRRAALRKIGNSFFRSWSYAASGFEKALAYLLAERRGEQGLIWQTAHGKVWKTTLPGALGEDTVVLKRYVGKRRWRHFCVPSPAAREAVNFLMLSSLGFPTVDLLAVGDNRRFLYLRDSFIVTRFLGDGFRDGIVFMRQTPEAGDDALRDSFLSAVLRQLAAMHSVKCLHRTSHPYSFLWRRSGKDAEGVEVVLIDVSSCRFKSARGFDNWVVYDLTKLFRNLRMSRETLKRHMDFYLSLNPGCGLSADRLALLVPTAGSGPGKSAKEAKHAATS